MTTYVQISAGQIVSGEKTAIGPRASFASMTEAQLNAVGWWTVTDTPPAFNPATQSVVATGLAVAGGIPTRQYRIDTLPIPLTPQQIATTILQGTDYNSVLWRGLIGALATQFGKTPVQIFNAIVNAAN